MSATIGGWDNAVDSRRGDRASLSPRLLTLARNIDGLANAACLFVNRFFANLYLHFREVLY
jgi:hypothetical protein